MSGSDEWEGEVHVLTVHSVRLPLDQFDDGEMDYDIEHPVGCTEKDQGFLGVTVTDYDCDLAWIIRDAGLPDPLRYSGTPVTEPGTYRIRAWGCKYRTDCGYEYDNGIGVVPDLNRRCLT